MAEATKTRQEKTIQISEFVNCFISYKLEIEEFCDLKKRFLSCFSATKITISTENWDEFRKTKNFLELFEKLVELSLNLTSQEIKNNFNDDSEFENEIQFIELFEF